MSTIYFFSENIYTKKRYIVDVQVGSKYAPVSCILSLLSPFKRLNVLVKLMDITRFDRK